jgi:hypothetical protein
VKHPYRSRPMAGTHEWLTPPEIIASLGTFDLDPCAANGMPWATAKNVYTKDGDGLKSPWFGRVWLNPPYGAETRKWLWKMREHGNGVALVFARTETEMFDESVWGQADAILFMKGRPHFYTVAGQRAKGNSGGPMVLIAYGNENVMALKASGIPGHLILLTTPPPREEFREKMDGYQAPSGNESYKAGHRAGYNQGREDERKRAESLVSFISDVNEYILECQCRHGKLAAWAPSCRSCMADRLLAEHSAATTYTKPTTGEKG